jgi:hypothetical protein
LLPIVVYKQLLIQNTTYENIGTAPASWEKLTERGVSYT